MKSPEFDHSSDLFDDGFEPPRLHSVSPLPELDEGELYMVIETGEERDELALEVLKGIPFHTDPVTAYLSQMGKRRLLSALEEVELAQRIEAGVFAKQLLKEDPKIESDWIPAKDDLKAKLDLEMVADDGDAAMETFISSNLRLVVSVAKRYVRPSVPLSFPELIQEGNLGLIRATEKFDYTRGYKFSTYAMWWIKQNIGRAIADQGRTIRLPVHMTETVYKVNRTRAELAIELHKDEEEVTPAEIAEAIELPLEKVEDIMDFMRVPVSLNKAYNDDGYSELGDFIADSEAQAPETAALLSLRSSAIESALDALDAREQAIIKMRFGLANGRPMTLDEIGIRIGLTRERIRQLEKKALGKLRLPESKAKLEDYLED